MNGVLIPPPGAHNNVKVVASAEPTPGVTAPESALGVIGVSNHGPREAAQIAPRSGWTFWTAFWAYLSSVPPEAPSGGAALGSAS